MSLQHQIVANTFPCLLAIVPGIFIAQFGLSFYVAMQAASLAEMLPCGMPFRPGTLNKQRSYQTAQL